jgi:putative PIN family toxin of toxin-antitoxin system
MPAENRSKPKVVIDTNVFVSGLTFKGKPRDVLDLVWRGDIEAYISSFILRELEETLRKDFGWDRDQIKHTIEKMVPLPKVIIGLQANQHSNDKSLW